MPSTAYLSQNRGFDSGDIHEVRKIIAEKVENGVHWYRVRWKGYPEEFDTWESEGNLAGCQRTISEWEKTAIAKPDQDTRKRKYGSVDRNGDDSDSVGGHGSDQNGEPIRKTRGAKPIPGTYAYARLRELLNEEESTIGHLTALPREKVKFLLKLQAIPGPPITLYNDLNDIPCPPVTFEFIPRYKFGEGVVDWVQENTAFWGGCTCIDNCKGSCSCMSEATYRRAYDKSGRVVVDNVDVLHECNDRCSCTMSCPNRVVQKGRKIPLEIFMTKDKGWGIRCPQPVPRGTFVDTYTGEVITAGEAELRGQAYWENGCSYLFDLDKFSKITGKNGYDDEDEADKKPTDHDANSPVMDEQEIYAVDGQHCGGVARFMNHSCDPNITIYCVTRERADNRLYDLAMFANQDIPAYEELTFNYNSSEARPEGGGKNRCYCGAKNCIGFLW